MYWSIHLMGARFESTLPTLPTFIHYRQPLLRDARFQYPTANPTQTRPRPRSPRARSRLTPVKFASAIPASLIISGTIDSAAGHKGINRADWFVRVDIRVLVAIWDPGEGDPHIRQKIDKCSQQRIARPRLLNGL